MDLAVFTIAKEGGGVLTLAVNTEDGGFFLEAGAQVGAGGVGQVVFDRLDLDLFQVKTQLLQAPLDFFVVAAVAAVAGQNGIQRTLGRIPVTFGIMPAGFFLDTDRGKGNGHDINIFRLDASLFEAEFGRLVGHAVFCMLVTHQALFFHGSNQLAINVQGGGRVVAQCAGQTQNSQCHEVVASRYAADSVNLR